MSATPLTAADYSDWLKYSGLYLENVSHAARYRTYQRKISAAGLAAKIVFDFLECNTGGLDLQRWRNANVYEIGADGAFRVEETARSLEAVGVPRVAGKIRTLRNTSVSALFLERSDPLQAMEALRKIDPAKMMEEFRANVARLTPGFAEQMAQAGMPVPQQKPAPPDPEAESWEQIEHLLAKYVQTHEAELRADMAKHGDVRTQPGFDPAKRMAELDRIRRAEYDREEQQEEAGKLQGFMDEIDKQLANNPNIKPGKIAKPRRAFLEIYRKYGERPADELVPAMRKVLDSARQYQEKHSGVFRPKPIDDDGLLKRLTEIGPFDTDIGNKLVRLNWDLPAGLKCDWTEFSLSIEYPIGDKRTLSALLAACDRLRRKFDKHQGELRQEILDSFEMVREQYEQMRLLDDYERGEQGLPMPAAILKHAGDGSICMTVPDAESGMVMIQVYFHVEWDDEHGLELSIEDEPEPAELAESGANVTFHDGGPAVTAEALAAFETQYGVSLPDDYRGFLLRQNGGRPEPNRLTTNMDGGTVPLAIEVLFSLGGADSLADALELFRADHGPTDYLPIGRVEMDMPMGDLTFVLLLAVTGKRAGRVLTAFESLAELPGMQGVAANHPNAAQWMAQMYEQSCQVVAPSFAAFLARLAPPRTS